MPIPDTDRGHLIRTRLDHAAAHDCSMRKQLLQPHITERWAARHTGELAAERAASDGLPAVLQRAAPGRCVA